MNKKRYNSCTNRFTFSTDDFLNMVPQMNDEHSDTYDKVRQARRDQLIDKCLEMGMPVVGDEDEDTLEMYIEMAYDDEFDDLNDESCTNDEQADESSNAGKITMLEKLVSLFM